jgi:hypothetical protein
MGPSRAGEEHGQPRTAVSCPRATRISQNVRLRRFAPSSRTHRPRGGTSRASPGTAGRTRNVPDSASRRSRATTPCLDGFFPVAAEVHRAARS